MMLYPPVADLVSKVGSSYALVNLVAKRARGFGMNVLVYDPYQKAEVVAAYRSGEVRHYGRQPKQHRVAGKLMTMREAAEMVGVSYDAMQLYTYKHRCSVARAVKYYEAKKQRRAEREILRIMGY